MNSPQPSRVQRSHSGGIDEGELLLLSDGTVAV
jgi:hypothetical protein